jgi:4-hydroxy-tetrahydrodipicolinate synthase
MTIVSAMTGLKLDGAWTALVTPFKPDGEIDWDAFDRLLERQIEGRVAGVVPCGTTGEAPTLPDPEHLAVIERTVARAKGRVQVLAGSSTNATKDSVALSVAARDKGAGALMVVMPYYNRPDQSGMFVHVKTIASAVRDTPIVLYNIPVRTGVTLSVETTLKILDAAENVVGIKDATGNVLYCQELIERAGDRVTVLSGDDALTLPMMSVGARGVISVTSNLYPGAMAELVSLVLAGRFDQAREKNRRLLPVHRALFSEPSPQPIKAALALKGLIQDGLRLPMVSASETCRADLTAMMAEFEGK